MKSIKDSKKCNWRGIAEKIEYYEDKIYSIALQVGGILFSILWGIKLCDSKLPFFYNIVLGISAIALGIMTSILFALLICIIVFVPLELFTMDKAMEQEKMEKEEKEKNASLIVHCYACDKDHKITRKDVEIGMTSDRGWIYKEKAIYFCMLPCCNRRHLLTDKEKSDLYF